jgi:HEPN domain-containing protein
VSSTIHTHQCVEKALKGYLLFKCVLAKKTHALEYLLELCWEHDVDFFILKNDVKKLDPFATQSRYPDDSFLVDRKEAEEAIKIAKKIFDFVRTKVESPGQKMIF